MKLLVADWLYQTLSVLAALLKAKTRVNDKVFFHSLESACSQLLSFSLPWHSLHMRNLFMLGCVKKKKKSTRYHRAGQINPEEELLGCKSKALFSWIVLLYLNSKSIMLPLQHLHVSKEFGSFAIYATICRWWGFHQTGSTGGIAVGFFALGASALLCFYLI